MKGGASVRWGLGPLLRVALIGTVIIAAALVCVVAATSGSPKVEKLLSLLLVGLLLTGLAGLSRRDPTTVLSVLVALLFLVPENFVLVGPLKSVGSPPLLLGLLAFGLWFSGRLLGRIGARRVHPYRWTIWAFALTSMTAYAAAMTRYLTSDEANSATRSIFPAVAMIGVALLATDGLTTVPQIVTLLKRLVFFGALEALAGILEYFTSFSYLVVGNLPGLSQNTDLNTLTSRDGFARVQAAASHPIEFSVAMAALAPLALHFALNASSKRERKFFWTLLCLILLAVPLPVSRSGILGVVVALGFYCVALNFRARINLLVLGVIGLGAFHAAVPGLLGTLKSFLFAGSSDNSIAGRTEDYSHIPGLMHGFWMFGRGFATFIPDQYFYLDNQYLMSLLNGGLVALVSLIALFVIGTSVARGARKRMSDRPTRDLAQALAGSIACLGLAAGTFDEFGFQQAAYLVFLLGGCAAALWTIATRQENAALSRGARHRSTSQLVTPFRVEEPAPGPAPRPQSAGRA